MSQRRFTVVRRLGAALGVVGLTGVLLSPGASAEIDPGSNYTVVARADAFAVEYLNTAAPVFGENAVVYGTPATAQSLVDSVGQSIAFAGAPYPGDVAVGLPDNGNGVVAGLGGPTVIPTYPFYVQSQHPAKPHAEQDQSGNRLVARSDQYTSASEARSGLVTGDVLAALQAKAASSAGVDSTTGAITATADSRLDALKVTDALQLGKSVAHARIVQQPGGEIVKESSFTIGSIVVGGIEMSYSDQGFKMGDQTPAPPGDPAPLFEALKQAGITVEILPATGTENSIESAGMKITQVQEFGGQTQRVSVILGRVSARIEGSAAPAGDSLLEPIPASSPFTDTISGDPAPPATGTGDALVGAAAAGAEPFPAAEAPASLGLPASDPPTSTSLAAAPPAASTPAGPGTVRLASPAGARGLLDDDVSGFYLALAVAGVIMFVGSRATGRLAGLRAAPAAGPSVLNLPVP
jgi:hypothetical protein